MSATFVRLGSAIALLLCASVRADALRVDGDAGAGGDGLTWDTAFQFLQDALDAAADSNGAVTEIRIAGGVQRPDLGESVLTGDRFASFVLAEDLAILGGFAGLGAPNPDERDPVAHETILSGDLAGDDDDDALDDNSFSVVTALDVSRTATLDGVTVTGGHADGAPPFDRGAGVRIVGGAPGLSRLVVRGNRATAGGGLALDDSEATLDGVLVTDNDAVVGGGLHVDGGAPTIVDARFESNRATTGGAVYADGAFAVFTQCAFVENEATIDGGAVAGVSGAPAFDQCAFRANDAGFDGGGASLTGGAATFDDCRFVANGAETGGGLALRLGTPDVRGGSFVDNLAVTGGGLAVVDADPIVFDVRFRGNASLDGGGASLDGAGGDFTLCRFVENVAENGAGLHGAAATTTIDVCRFEANLAGRTGGGVAFDGGAPTMTSCVVMENIVAGGFVANGGGAFCAGDAAPHFHYVMFVGNEAKFGGGVAAIDASPTFEDCMLQENVGITGGAVFLSNGEAALDACLLLENDAVDGATSSGGAMHVIDASATLVDCTVSGNECDLDGGAFHVENGALALDRCTVDSNTSLGLGGAVSVEKASLDIVRSSLTGNRAVRGGAIYGLFADLVADGSLLAANVATGGAGCAPNGVGGAMRLIAGSGAVTGCTIVDNRAECDGAGGGIDGLFGTVANTILWGNEDATGRSESAQIRGGAPNVNACCIEALSGALGGDGNVGADPRLTIDHRLGAGSSCIDAGFNALVPAGVTFDLDGGPRFVDDPGVDDTGQGDAPVVDIGADERDPTCGADVDGDGAVGFTDILVILSSWGPCSGCDSDVDGNGSVDFSDLLVVLSSWGPCST